MRQTSVYLVLFYYFIVLLFFNVIIVPSLGWKYVLLYGFVLILFWVEGSGQANENSVDIANRSIA